jgi:3-dehydroquinate synthase
VKHAAIRSEPLLRYLEKRLAGILKCQTGEMTHVISESVRIKAGVVVKDEKENDLRMVLNYGHTIGHAFEAATGYKRFKHGEAVAWGMIAATGFSYELGFLRPGDAMRLIDLVHKVGTLPSLKGISFTRLWNALLRDKKFRSGHIRMVLLPQIGNSVIKTGIDPLMLRRFLKRFLSTGGNLEISNL